MQYFKYKNINKNLNNALKEQYKTLNNCEKRIFSKREAVAKSQYCCFDPHLYHYCCRGLMSA